VRTNKNIPLAFAGILALIMMAFTSCGGQNGSQGRAQETGYIESQDSVGQPVMVFDTLVHDFGTIIEGEQVICYFDYFNGGDKELVITSVEATCGCTTPNWSHEPLEPGEKGSLAIIFDASGRSGIQRKVVTVMSNASNQVVRLTIRANVNNSV
jgi:hypothetical protein